MPIVTTWPDIGDTHLDSEHLNYIQLTIYEVRFTKVQSIDVSRTSSAAMKANDPLVSILMPYYRLGEFLVDAVQSVKNQTYQNWELIIVDDCSPDNPALEVLASETDARIHVSRNEKNLGCAASRNVAAAQSKGEYFLPLDSDDVLAPTYIEKTVKAMAETGASAVYTHVKYFGKQELIYIPSIDLVDIFTGHFPCNTLLLKRESFDIAGGYKNLNVVEDTEFWISLIESGAKFTCIPEPLYHYRFHDRSTMHLHSKKIMKGFYNILLLHHTAFAEHLEGVLKKWCEFAESSSDGTYQQKRQMEIAKTDASNSKFEAEFSHLESEMKSLKEKYRILENRVKRNEQMLASLPSLTRQISYLALKKVRLR
ncbi:MAG TPA: glycosyltransferase [Candidatus Melainabacteria bacterium]|nr:glycosyltransferase [Candidatus Melainabacteria bacterium]